MNGKANGSRPGRSGSAADDSSDDEFDPASFQAELDASVHSSRSLVQSWLPSNLGSEWDDAFSAQKGAVGLQGLKDAMRPARLGLGAQPAAAHKQLAEDRKIKNRLLGKNPRALGDEGADVKLNKDAADANSSDDDEEESRAGAIGKKGKGTSNGIQDKKKDYVNPFLLPKAKPSTPLKSDVHAAADVGGKALFNAPSPAKPAPPASASPQAPASTSMAAPLVAASAFYGGGGSQDGAGGAQLTKNQRKKERQREKAAALKRQREEESRLEEETEQQRKRTKTGDTAPGKRSADGNDELADAKMDATERGGVETSRTSSGSNDDDGGEAPSPCRSRADSATAAAGGASSPGKRKKKKKKKVSGGAGSGSGAAAEGPLLNLG